MMEVMEEEEKKRMGEEREEKEGNERETEELRGKDEASHVTDKITSSWKRRRKEEKEKKEGEKRQKGGKKPELGWPWLALAGLGLFLSRAWLHLAYTTPDQAIDLLCLKTVILLQR